MVTVGIDPHKKTHTAVIIDDAGRRLGRALTVADEPSAVAKLRAWVAKSAPGEPARFAIEDGRGLARRLATALVVAGYEVLWVPVRLVIAERQLTGPRGKSDPIDALAAAKAALNPDNARYLSAHSLDEAGAEVAPLVDYRADLVAQRTRLIAQLRWRLHELAPGLEPASLTTQKAPRELAARLRTFAPSTLIQVLIDTCDDLARLSQRIATIGRDLTTRVQRLCPHLLAVPGIATITAATILAELGNPTRVRNAAALARMAGTAPIPVWSSNTERHRLDRGGNRRLNAAIHRAALTQARAHTPAQTLITKHLDKKGKRGAMRVLKRHLTRVIYRALRQDFPDPTCQQPAA
jgi:transposase